MRILNFLWLKSTENITIFNYIPNTAPQFLQIKNYFHPKLEHISKTYIRCPRYSDRHCTSFSTYCIATNLKGKKYDSFKFQNQRNFGLLI